MKPFAILLFLFLPAFHVIIRAQTSPDVFSKLETRRTGEGSVRIIQDNVIRDFVNLHLTRQKQYNGIMGYKISIYRGLGQEARTNANLVRSKFLSKFEGTACEITWEYPYWKVYVGAFRTRSDALMFLKKIVSDYPNEAFIRLSLIPFPD